MMPSKIHSIVCVEEHVRVYMSQCVETRGQCWLFSSILSTLCLSLGLSLEPGAQDTAKLASQELQGSACLSPLPLPTTGIPHASQQIQLLTEVWS